MLSWWQILVFPLAVIFDLITRIRNYLYDSGINQSYQPETLTISVGNLAVGGTGKTPMVAFLITYLLDKKMKVAVLSRGYGRKTRGFRICGVQDNPNTVGDEPYLFYQRYKDKIYVAVGESRVNAIKQLLTYQKDIDVILLDDAFQHRQLRPHLQVLLTTQKQLFWNDFLMPTGRLRESSRGVCRSDAIVITKCEAMLDYPYLIKMKKPYFLASNHYLDLTFFFGEKLNSSVVAIAGLANNTLFFDYVSSKFQVTKTFSYPDHHKYGSKDIIKILYYLQQGASLLTTEKDAMKLKQFQILHAYSCAYIPIQTIFIKNETLFSSMIDRFTNQYVKPFQGIS